MSRINNPVLTSIHDFVATIYTAGARNIFFWDTCSLLEILRFPYRGGDVNGYRILNRINGLIQADTIYSIASSLTVTEWNDNENDVKDSMRDSLTKTDHYHSTCLGVANEIFGTGHMSEPISNKDLVQNLEHLADSIIAKTIFIRTDEIANSALERVRDKFPPSAKKPEFKDCAVWETALKLSRDIYAIDNAHDQVFYTVNTDDFVDKSREPRRFHGILLTEAALSNLRCGFTIGQVDPMI